jgi:hypothetical protein
MPFFGYNGSNSETNNYIETLYVNRNTKLDNLFHVFPLQISIFRY